MTLRRSVRNLRQERYERARWWLSHGVEVLPLKPRSKELQPGYGSWRAHISDVVLARQWFLNTDANLGVVLGGEAGLIVVDWDDVRDYETWRNATGATVDTLTERTARGYHLFFIGEGPRSAVGDGCEFKATGACAVSPSVHPSGVVYRIVNDTPIVYVGEERLRVLFPFLSDSHGRDERDRSQAIPTESAPGGLKRHASAGGGVIDRIKAMRSTVDEMNAAGIRLRQAGDDAVVGLCPFHDDHRPSLWAYPDSGLWGCNKPSCPAAGVHDVINFRALARGVSNTAAIRQLADEFL